MDAGLSEGQSDFLMVDRRDGNNCSVDAGVYEGLNRAEHVKIPSDTEPVSVWVGNGDKIEAFKLSGNSDVVTSDGAEPDDTNSDVSHLSRAFHSARVGLRDDAFDERLGQRWTDGEGSHLGRTPPSVENFRAAN